MHERVIHRHDKLDHNMPPPALLAYHNDPVIQYLLLCLDIKNKQFSKVATILRKKDKDFIVNC